MRPLTSILSLLFQLNQPYSDALRITADSVLELLEAKLDEGIGSLEKDQAKRAREEIAILREFNGFDSFIKEANKVLDSTVPEMPENPESLV